ncbi:MAG: NAD(P)/FAD-dependent oxidoreductase, partial [Eubacteriales bacterium]
MEYVIIGNGPAAVGAVEGIREKDKLGGITIISDEKYHTYSRPLISYLLEGKTDEERMKYRPDSFYDENGVKTLLGVRAEKIDAEKKHVILSDKSTVKYDKLLIATGSSPFVPKMEGLEGVKNRFSFMSLDDAHALESACESESRVLIIGAGLIGLKCAEGIKERVKSIHVVDLSPRILSSILDSTGAEKMQRHLEKNGISFHLDTSVEKFEDNTALLKNGEKIPFDILVTAVGVKPNISLLKDIGAETNRGIIVGTK